MIDEARIKTENVSQSSGDGVKETELSSWMRYFGVDESDEE